MSDESNNSQIGDIKEESSDLNEEINDLVTFGQFMSIRQEEEEDTLVVSNVYLDRTIIKSIIPL